MSGILTQDITLMYLGAKLDDTFNSLDLLKGHEPKKGNGTYEMA
jgi:hypothetical protein